MTYWQLFTQLRLQAIRTRQLQCYKRYMCKSAGTLHMMEGINMKRLTGTCKTCNRKQVTLVAADECSVCHRVAGVASKVLAGKPITASDQHTMRRVIAATKQGVTTSIEAKVAQKKGWVELFAGRGNGKQLTTAGKRATATEPVATWPRPATGWECSDGTLVADEVTALKHELDLVRGGQRRAA
jgi:hypothetical protein